MPTYTTSNGDDFVVKRQDRAYKGVLSEVLKVDGNTGTLTVANLTNTGAAGAASLAVTGAATVGGTLAVTGNTTMTGSLTIGGNTPMTGRIWGGAITGRNGAGAVTLTGARVGDTVVAIVNLTTPGDLNAGFEDTITVADQIQQSSASDLSAAQILVLIKTP